MRKEALKATQRTAEQARANAREQRARGAQSARPGEECGHRPQEREMGRNAVRVGRWDKPNKGEWQRSPNNGRAGRAAGPLSQKPDKV